ncbi:MAG: GFA family protein [Alphaproteobacteria bacterium]|nr:GFA family protein [Alphaproteobacteria bacterium]
MCRRASGAPVLAFATVLREHFVVTRGDIASWKSSEIGSRGFCRDCGTQLTMSVAHQPDTLDFTIASLDEPDAVAPDFHIWFGSRISWFDTSDAKPRHERFRADTRGLPDRYRDGVSTEVPFETK